MTGPLIFTMAGIAVLYAGAELLVRGSLALSVRLRISSLLTGVLVVGLGTSSPELIVSLQASLLGSGEMAVGNIVGSNISNLALILGLAALIRPVHSQPSLLRREFPLLLAVSVVLSILLVNGSLTRLDGVLMLAGLLLWIGWMVRSDEVPVSLLDAEAEATTLPGTDTARLPDAEAATRLVADAETTIPPGADGATPPDADALPDASKQAGGDPSAPLHKQVPAGRLSRLPLFALFVITLAGLGLLLLASHWIVNGAAELARLFGLSEGIIGLSLVAVGTSLPELATVVVAAIKRENGLIMGTLLGSNMLNLLFVLGVTGLTGSILLDSIVIGDLVLMTLLVLAVWPLAARGLVGRAAGLALLAAYAGWLAWLFVR